MYIKLSFIQGSMIIPGSWDRLIVAFPDGFKPTIIDKLPPDTLSNEPVNIKNVDHNQNGLDDSSARTKEYLEVTYDYYYDCSNLSKDVAKVGLKLFLKEYAGNVDAKVATLLYPEVHPAIELLKQSLAQASCLLSPKISNSVHRFIITPPASHTDENKFIHLPPSTGF